MSIEEVLREARDAVLEWRDVRGMPRPRSLPRGETVKVVRVELRIPYERRSLDAETEPAPPATWLADEPKAPDPWSIAIDAPRDGSESSQRVPLEASAHVAGCKVCQGAKRFRCDDCHGTGVKVETTRDPITGLTVTRHFPCGTCMGEGTVRCQACGATGYVRVTPIVVVATATELRRELVDDGSLPADLRTEIRRAPSARFWSEKSLHSVKGEDPKLAPWGGQRPSRLASSASSVVETMWNDPIAPDRRARGLRVDVVEGLVVRFRLPGRDLWVWGSPARVYGDDDPVATGPSAPLIFAGALAAALAAGAWWLLR